MAPNSQRTLAFPLLSLLVLLPIASPSSSPAAVTPRRGWDLLRGDGWSLLSPIKGLARWARREDAAEDAIDGIFRSVLDSPSDDVAFMDAGGGGAMLREEARMAIAKMTSLPSSLGENDDEGPARQGIAYAALSAIGLDGDVSAVDGQASWPYEDNHDSLQDEGSGGRTGEREEVMEVLNFWFGGGGKPGMKKMCVETRLHPFLPFPSHHQHILHAVVLSHARAWSLSNSAHNTIPT